MGKADTVTKQYLRDPVVFADACNFIFGERKVRPDDLTELSETELAVPHMIGGGADPVQKFRDSMKRMMAVMEDGRSIYMMLGVENQMAMNYAMPVRTMLYDALRYSAQAADIARQHREKRDFRGRTRSEFLSGMLREDKLIPVITIVLYYGDEVWDAPRSLHEMLDIPDESYLPWIGDYRIHIIEPAAMTDDDLERFQSSLREVMTFAKYASDKEKIRAAVEQNEHFRHLDPLAKQVIEVIAGEEIRAEKGEDGSYNMCKAFADMRMEARAEGRSEGKAEGRAEGREYEKDQIILRMYAQGFRNEQIVSVAGVDFARIQKVIEDASVTSIC